MEKRTQTGLVMGHAYGVTAVKKVNLCKYTCIIVCLPEGQYMYMYLHVHCSLIFNCHVITIM